MRRTLQTLSHSFAAGAAAAAAFAAAAGAFHVFHPACFLSAGFFVGGPSNTDGRLLFAELPLGFGALLGLGGGGAVLLLLLPSPPPCCGCDCSFFSLRPGATHELVTSFGGADEAQWSNQAARWPGDGQTQH